MRPEPFRLSLPIALSLAACSVQGSLGKWTGGAGGGDETEPTEAGNRHPGIAEGEPHPDQPSGGGRAAFDRMIVIEPEPGMPEVDAIAIDWCNLVTVEHGSGGALARALSDMEERGWHWQHVPKVATLLCTNPGDSQYQRQAGYFIQGLVNITGQSPERVIADLKLRLDQKSWLAQRQAHCSTFELSDEASAEHNDLTTASRELFGCGRDEEPAWWLQRATTRIGHHLDRVAVQPSQLLLSYHVMQCLSTASDDKLAALAYALCGTDAEALDEARLERELTKAGANDYARTIARQHHSFVRRRAAAIATRVRAMTDKNAAYRQLVFEAPAKAWKRWQQTYRRHRKALDAAADYQAAFYGPSRKAARNCSADLRASFRAYVRSKRPKSLDEAKAAATDSVGLLLMARLTACEALEGNAHAADMLYRVGHEARPASGPRMAVYFAVIDALNEIREDRPRFPISHSDLPRPDDMPIWKDAYSIASNDILAMQSDAGVVKSATRRGDGVLIQFKTESWVEDDWNCRDTNKVWKIDSSGRVLYHKSCKKVGKRTVRKTPQPIWLATDYAAGVRPGAFLEIDYDLNRREGAFIGVVKAAYSDKSKRKLVAAYGIEL